MALLAVALTDRLGAAAVAVLTSVAAVLTWLAAGWFGSASARAAGAGRPVAGLSAAAGGAAGYLVVPGLLSVVGLLATGAGAGAVLAGPVLSALLAGAAAGGAAAAAPHAPAPAPYQGA